MKFTKVTQLSKGWSSYIWLVKDKKNREFVLKEVREKSTRKNLAEREGRMLQLANKAGVGPQIEEVNFKGNYVVMEYIKGEKLADWVMGEDFAKVTREELWEFIKALYKQLLALDSVHLSHNQLQIGKNILVREVAEGKLGGAANASKYEPAVIDFEKATVKENGTKNIGQMESFLFYNPHGAVANKVREKLGAEL